jgi:integrase
MRGKGEGSVYKRKADGLWAISIELPPHAGKRRRRVIARKDKEALLIEFDKQKEKLRKSGDLPTADQTVEEWLTYWLDRIAVKENRPKTLANYRSFVKTHIIPAIGKKRLDKLTPANIRTVTDNMVGKDGKPLAATTQATAHRIMSSAFSAAERDGRMSRNPAKLARAPRIPATELEVLDVDEAIRLVKLFGETSDAFLWVTYMLTGARRGEILGLEWDRVTDVLDLSWQLQRHPVEMVAPADYEFRRLQGGLYLTRPKSKAGWRVVPLVEPLAGVLRHWRAIAPPNAHNLVFATADGDPIDPDFASKEWPKVLKAAGIEKHVRLHDLRHTAVDLLYEAGVHESIIQEIVGHSNRSMTRAYKSRGNRPQLTDGMKQLSALLGVSQ